MKFFDFTLGSLQGSVRELAQSDIAAIVSALVFQTHPDSTGINRLLQGFGLQPKLIDDQNPSGMARPGLFNSYQLREDELRSIATRGKSGV